jgi:uncharacterized protein (DUF1330 family)
MTAYIVFTRERLRNPDEMQTYAGKAGASMAGHEGKALAFYGAHETLEGAPIDGAVIVAFPDLAAAKAWYQSPAYQEAVKHRFAGADYRVFITEGM